MVYQESVSFLCPVVFMHKMDVIRYEVHAFDNKYTTTAAPFIFCICNLPCEVVAMLSRYYAKVADVETVSDIHKILSSQRVWSCKSIADIE